eukprot:m.51107 g.51107  ORF g.51107 m.51107 type:complete len:698 (+) comp10929_c0_seq5:98-2191(+)
MYGVLHKGLTTWLLTLDESGELLQRVEDEVGIEGTIDDFFRYYTTQQTEKFLQVSSKLTNTPIATCMMNAGIHFLDGVLESGYGHMLKALGDTFFDLLDNLDSLHESFVPSFPEMKISSFRPRRGDDGTMIVAYFSEGKGLPEFTMGALKACALHLFGLEVDVRHTMKKKKDGNHDEFRLFVDASAFPSADALDNVGLKELCTIDMSKDIVNNLLPWHFAFDSDLKLVSIGHELSGRLHAENPIGMDASEIFTIVRPVAFHFDYETLSQLDETVGMTIVIKSKFLVTRSTSSALSNALNTIQSQSLSLADGSRRDSSASLTPSVASFSSAFSDADMKKNAELAKKLKNIKLHGQVVQLHDGVIGFFGTPTLRSFEEMEMQGVELRQMPLHSHARDVLFGSMFLSSSAQNSVLVDKKLADLDTTMIEVEEKKTQIDSLLHSILPPVVANSLALGDIPPAERYENVTVLFASVYNFSLITSEIPAAQVMGMLHELFVKFDDLTEKHGCYKVETNGDAYVVACGCPEEHPDHAERMAYLAIDMIQIAKEVTSPLDGEPIHVIIGMHTGSLMAGVVGRARPRYCLFGDTVNFTEQLARAGLPGAIQTSYRYVQALPEEHPLRIVARGHINIEGKSNVKAFLLLGSTYDEDIEAALPEQTLMSDIAPRLVDMTISTSERELEDRVATILASRGQRLAKKQLL